MLNRNGVIWITGLSGAGKTTLAREVARQIKISGECVVVLDGDELRAVMGRESLSEKNHSKEERLAIAMQYAHLCQIIANEGVLVIIATISLFREVHAWNRANLPGYYEVFLDVPIEELRRRDPKGIYRRYEAGQISNVAGLDLSIDEPEAPDLVIEYSKDSDVVISAHKLLNHFFKKDII